MQMNQSRKRMYRGDKDAEKPPWARRKWGERAIVNLRWRLWKEAALSHGASVPSLLRPSHTFLELSANAFTIRRCGGSAGLLRHKEFSFFLFFYNIISFNLYFPESMVLIHLKPWEFGDDRRLYLILNETSVDLDWQAFAFLENYFRGSKGSDTRIEFEHHSFCPELVFLVVC